jgi:hypothetical protein
MTRTCLLTALCALATAAPSGAVVGGGPVPVESVPWLADVGSCGGTLVAGRARLGGLWAGGGRVLSPDTASDSASSV